MRFYLLNPKKYCTFAARNPTKGCLHIGGGFCRHIKKAFIALCSDVMKCRKFQGISGLSNDRCPTGYRLSLLCLLVRLLRICVCAHAYLNYSGTRVYFIFGVGFALSVLNSKAMRQPHNVELADSKFHAFIFVPYCTY